MRRILILILFTNFLYSNRSNENFIKDINYNKINEENNKPKKDDIENINKVNYNGLNKEKRVNMDFMIDKIETNRISLINSLRSRYFLKANKTNGEIFLESLDNDVENKNIFGIGMNYRYIKNEHFSFPNIYYIKNINNNGNFMNFGIYSGYKNYINEKTHGLSLGTILEFLISEYNFNLISLNEYNYIYNKEYNLNLNLISGASKLGFYKYLGNMFYINPSLILTYSTPTSSQTLFNETNVTLNDGLNFSLGGNLKVGIEKENNDLLYNLFLDFEIDKILKNKYNFSLEFKNRVAESVANKDLPIIISGGAGVDFLIKNTHRIKFLGNVNVNKKKVYYGFTFNYEIEK